MILVDRGRFYYNFNSDNIGKNLAFHCISFPLTLNFLFDDEMYLNFEFVKIGFLLRGSCVVKIIVYAHTHEGGDMLLN